MARRYGATAGTLDDSAESAESGGADAAEPSGPDRARLLAALPQLAAGEAVFLPADPPRLGRIAFWAPEDSGAALPELGVAPEELTVVRPDAAGTDVREVRVPAVVVPVEQAVPLLTRCRALGTSGRASAGTAFWGTAAVLGLNLLARGRVLPGVSPDGFDAWRVGPLDPADREKLGELAAAMPPEARAVPLPGLSPLALPAAEPLLRSFLDAVADSLTRTPAARHLAGGPAFAASAPQPVPEQRPWAAEVAAGRDAGLQVSLRLELMNPAGLNDPSGPDDLDVPEPEPASTPEPEPAREPGSTPEPASGPAPKPAPSRDDDNAPTFRAVVQLRSLADPTVLADAADLWAGTAVAPELFGPRARVDTMLTLRRAARAWPPAARLLDAAAPTGLVLSDEEAQQLLGEAAERLALAGVAVHWPKGLVRELTAAGVLEPARQATTSSAASVLSSEGLLEFRWRVALGDGEELTPDELERLAEAHRPIVRLRDQWVVVDPELVRRLRRATTSRPSLTAIDALGAVLSGSVEVDGEQVAVAAGGALEELRARIADPEARAAREPTGPPRALAASLRAYQQRGLDWLHRMTSLGLGACLADDMGLGKTVTLIALHLRRQERAATAGPTLVVCPASLLGNWEREIRRFAPTAPVRRFHGPGRTLPGVDGTQDTTRDGLPADPTEGVAPGDPDGAPSDAPDGVPGTTSDGTPGTITDGSPGTTADGSPSGSAPGFVLTTYGTMRRDAALLAAHPWGLVVADEAQHVKNPYAHTAQALRTIPSRGRVALTGTPVENNLSELWALLDWTTPGLLGTLPSFRDRYAKAVEGDRDEDAARRLAGLVRPFLLRRRKSDPGIAPELPPKTETEQPVTLTREQVSLYEALVREMMAEIEGKQGMTRRGLVMKLLTGLKQVCNHPAQFLKEPADARLPGRSGKLELLDELLDTVLAEDGSALVFTQYVAMGRLIERHLAGRGVETLFLHGATPVARREEMVDAFQSGGKRVFLLSLKAAGTGLNLTRAGHVVHYDRWWNPAVEDQATDRAYRIGQTQAVQVHKLVTEGTVEERVADMLRQKRELADAVLGSGEAAFSELTDDELAELVALRGRRR
ncbi:SNF2-related protein [Actinacidiphila acidipaludis]|uniref:SNF2-related protein n=1 Tax=Actinacidiphila acidipaludis TaxID=2873382 RepID=UPI00223A8265|nr:SNF2-related protein [Streptomyces acidipaludis]